MSVSEDRSAAALFQSLAINNLRFSNRVVMAPMTRSRALATVPDASTAEYYRQRASAGLIITEGTVVSPQGRGFLWTPGLYSLEQRAGWRRVVDAVHGAGGKIFVQLWHVGRMSHDTLQDDGRAPGSSVVSQIKSAKVFAYDGDGHPAQLEPSRSRALTRSEIHEITEDFVLAAKNAMTAGFDGVEIHAANGYLFDQFMNGDLNDRPDEYGGEPVENRLRFLLETVDGVCAAVGSGRVGVRISPLSRLLDLRPYDSERQTVLTLTAELAKRKVAYLHLSTSRESGAMEVEIRKAFPGKLILCGEFTFEKAQEALENDVADLIGFGRPYVANPDLVARMCNEWPVVEADKSVYYGGGDAGYIDFPCWDEK